MGRKFKKFYRINEQIRAPQVRLIDASGKSLGVLSNEEAFKKARAGELDLVEIAPKAIPPVVKLIKYSKFLYQEEKRAREQKTRGGETKEIRFSPFIAENDYQVRIARISQFLNSGNKVRIVVRFFRAQLSKKQFGYNLIKRIVTELGNARVEQEPKFLGRNLMATISLSKGGKQNGQDENQKINNKAL